MASTTIIALLSFLSDRIEAPIVTILDTKLQTANEVGTISAGIIMLVRINRELNVAEIPNLMLKRAIISSYY